MADWGGISGSIGMNGVRRILGPDRAVRSVLEDHRAIAMLLAVYGRSGVSDVDGGELRGAAEAAPSQAVSAGADARAAISVQPGLRGVREDSISVARAQEAAYAGAVLQGGGRVRGADREHSGGGAALAPADRPDRRGAGRAEEVHLPVHERAAAEGEAAPVSADEIPDVQRAHGRSAGTPRLRGVPRGRV